MKRVRPRLQALMMPVVTAAKPKRKKSRKHKKKRARSTSTSAAEDKRQRPTETEHQPRHQPRTSAVHTSRSMQELSGYAQLSATIAFESKHFQY